MNGVYTGDGDRGIRREAATPADCRKLRARRISCRLQRWTVRAGSLVPPPAAEPAPVPPPQPPHSGLAGKYELEFQLSPSCAAPSIVSYFSGSTRSERSRTYPATITGTSPALVHIPAENVGDSFWGGDSFLIEHNG